MTSITGLYQCPNCSITVTFRSRDTRLIVCPGCKASLGRLDDDSLVDKNMFIVTDHNDIIQPGVTGVWQDKTFEVIGRIRVYLDESVVNYWTISFDDNTLGYLVESYGLYAILVKTAIDKFIVGGTLASMELNTSINLLNDTDFFLQHKDTCKKYEIEQEVWMPECRNKLQLFDFASMDGQRFSLIEFLPGILVAYKVFVISFKELQLKNLNDNKPEVKSIECRECHSKIEIQTFPYAQSCACPKCRARYELNSNFDAKPVQQKSESEALPDIALGSVGEIKGIAYKVLGFAQKEDFTSYASRWKEYTLHNREEGYAFLSEYDGHWVFVRERLDAPVLSSRTADRFYYAGEDFLLYNQYGFKVIGAAGEFPYNIYDEREIMSSEYISPPEMWITEKSKDEGVNWFHGESISKGELEKAFGADLPEQSGLGTLDPKGYVNPEKIVLVTVIAIVAMLLVHFFMVWGQEDKVIVDQNYFVSDSTLNSFVTDKFELKRWRSNLEFEITAGVDNNWFELDITLVNAKTGTEYTLEQGVEYYHGYEDGETWSEGSTRETAYMSSIPAGIYYLQFSGVKERGVNLDRFNLTVKNDVPLHRNMFIFIILLLIWPVYKYYIVNSNERKRWYNSNYSPYTYE